MRRAPSKRAIEPNARAVDLMLDSGAFSAFKHGVVIDLARYAEFLKVNRDVLDAYINLDVIPGRPGKAASGEEVEAAAEQSFKNYEWLRSEGLEPMPVFHYGESPQWLERMLDSGAPYIGLGGTVGKPQQVRVGFFKKCFELIKKSGHKVKTHGFGCTSASIMLAFPFTSVDSTSWVMGGANGYIMVPKAGPTGLNYRSLQQVRTTGLGNMNNQIGGFGDLYRKHVLDFLQSIGVTLEDVCVSQASRNLVNMWCSNELAKIAKTQMYFSTWMRDESNQASILTKAGMRLRLMSYWELYEYAQAIPQLRTYVETGTPDRERAVGKPLKAFGSEYVVKRTRSFLTRFADGEVESQ